MKYSSLEHSTTLKIQIFQLFSINSFLPYYTRGIKDTLLDQPKYCILSMLFRDDSIFFLSELSICYISDGNHMKRLCVL